MHANTQQQQSTCTFINTHNLFLYRKVSPLNVEYRTAFYVVYDWFCCLVIKYSHLYVNFVFIVKLKSMRSPIYAPHTNKQQATLLFYAGYLRHKPESMKYYKLWTRSKKLPKTKIISMKGYDFMCHKFWMSYQSHSRIKHLL